MPRRTNELKTTTVVQLVDTPRYAAWLTEVANATHLTKATLARLALTEFAANHNLPEPPTAS